MITTSLLLVLGCVVDKLLARIGPVERYIERLPLGRSHGECE